MPVLLTRMFDILLLNHTTQCFVLLPAIWEKAKYSYPFIINYYRQEMSLKRQSAKFVKDIWMYFLSDSYKFTWSWKVPLNTRGETTSPPGVKWCIDPTRLDSGCCEMRVLTTTWGQLISPRSGKLIINWWKEK